MSLNKWSKELGRMEQELRSRLKACDLIGEIEVDQNELDEIQRLLHGYLKICQKDGDGFVRANQNFQTLYCATVACYLVHRGIRDYHAGDFWSGIKAANLTQQSHAAWGQVFEAAIKSLRLVGFSYPRDEPHLRYVTPILGHGGIPNSSLPEFFEHLLVPAATGRLVFGSVDELIEEWLSNGKLIDLADKNVRRFFQYGGRAARNFLARCLDMATQIIAKPNGQFSHNDFGVPSRVLAEFEKWRRWSRSSFAPEEAQYRPRRPEIHLDLASHGLILRFPEQAVPKHLVANSPLPVEWEQTRLPASPQQTVPEPVKLWKRRTDSDGRIHTSDEMIPLSEPFDNLTVTFNAGRQSWEWSFSGITDRRHWLAFDLRRRMITVEPLDAWRVWLVTPRDWEIRGTEIEPEAEIWNGYFVRRLDLAGATQVELSGPDGCRESIPVDLTSDSRPYLEGCRPATWPPMHAGTSDDVWANCEEIYFDCLPTLVLPDATDRWAGCSLRLTRHDEDGGNDQVVFERALEGPAMTDRRIPLAPDKPAKLNTWGRYSIRIRGRLRQDVCLRFVCLPAFEIDCTLDDSLPDRETGSRHVRLVLTCTQPLSIHGIQDTICSPLDSPSTRHEVRVPSHCRVAHLRMNPAEGVQIPVSIKVPRVEWAIYDEGRPTRLEFTGKAIDVDWQDFHSYRQPKLFIRCGIEPAPRLSLHLDDDLQVEQPEHDSEGKYAIKLGRWSSTIEALGRSVSTLKLRIDFETSESGDAKTYELAVVRFRKEWIVDGEPTVSLSDRADGCWIDLAWQERSPVKNRILRLWATDENLAAESRVPDGETSATLKLKDRSDAKYRLEFALDDEWNGPQFAHNLYEKNVRELIIRDGQAECLSREGQLEALLQAVADGCEVSDSELTQVLEDAANDTHATERFCKAVFKRCDAAKDFAYASRAIGWIVKRSELGEALERVAEAAWRLKEREPGIARFFAEVLVDRDVLAQTWGSQMQCLLTVLRTETTGKRTKTDSTLLRLADLYAKCKWLGPAFGYRFLHRLKRIGNVYWKQDEVVRLKYCGSGRSNPFLVYYQYKDQGSDAPREGNVKLLRENWNEVGPEKSRSKKKHWKPTVEQYVLSHFQRGLAWSALQVSQETAEQINQLAMYYYHADPTAYLEALFEAEKDLANWMAQHQGETVDDAKRA